MNKPTHKYDNDDIYLQCICIELLFSFVMAVMVVQWFMVRLLLSLYMFCVCVYIFFGGHVKDSHKRVKCAHIYYY